MKYFIKHIGFLFFTILLVSSINAADTVLVTKDPRLDILSAKQVQMNKRNAMMTPNGMYKGFRIQVISTNKRDDAFRIKAELLARYPEHKTYVIFQSPNFKVRIGNFINREDAEKLKAVLNRAYPQGVYIVEDGVEYVPKEAEEVISQ